MKGLRQNDRVQATLDVRVEGGPAGQTRDLSPSGIYFTTEAELDEGQSIAFSVEFENPAGNLILHCKGEVVRVETSGERCGVAVRILESHLERSEREANVQARREPRYAAKMG